MSYEQKPLKKVNGMPVPQYWNHETNDWEIVEGSAGAYRMNSPTKVAKEPFSASANLTKEFTSDMHGIVISNDGNADLTFTIAGETYTVKAGEVYEGDFEAFRSVIVNSTAPFRAHGKKAVGSAVVTPPPADTTAPDNVTNVTATSVTETTLTLNWTASASTDTAGYDVYRGTTLLSTVTGTTFNVTGLAASTQYTFTVKAKDGANNIATGTPFTVTTAAASADTTPPNNVTNLTPATVTHNSLTLSWSVSSSSDVASYEVYRGTTLLGTVTGTTYNLTGLTASTSYTFAVKAKDTSSNVATGTSVTVTTAAQPADTTPPADVTGLTAGTATQTGVTLTWTASASTDIKDYNVYNGTTLLATVTATTYGVTGLTASTAYTFVVKARDTANNEAAGVSVNVTTAASAPPADTTPPEPVTGLTAGTVTSSSIPVNWTLSTSSDVANYEVAYSTDAGATYTVASAVVNASSTSYTVTGLNANTAYTLRVVAIDGAGNRSTGVTVTANTAGLSTILADTFTATDGTAVQGRTTEVGGKVWTVLSAGDWRITNNLATNVGAPIDAVIAVDSGYSDCVVTVKIAKTNSNMRVCFRGVDGGNYLFLRVANTIGYDVYKRVNGLMTNLGTLSVAKPMQGDIVKVTLSGTSINVSVNGVAAQTFTITELATATKHGIGTNGSITDGLIGFDDFKVEV